MMITLARAMNCVDVEFLEAAVVPGSRFLDDPSGAGLQSVPFVLITQRLPYVDNSSLVFFEA